MSHDIEGMARETGLEPATSGVTGRRSNQLSYSRIPAPARHVMAPGRAHRLGPPARRVNSLSPHRIGVASPRTPRDPDDHGLDPSLCHPRRPHGRLGNPRAPQDPRTTRHPLLRRRHPRPQALPHAGRPGRQRRHPVRPRPGRPGPAIHRKRRLPPPPHLARQPHGRPRHPLHHRQHRHDRRLPAGPRLPRQAPGLPRRHRPRHRPHLPRRAPGLQRLRTPLRPPPPRRQHDPHSLRRSRPPRPDRLRLRRPRLRQPHRRLHAPAHPKPPARPRNRPRHPRHRGRRLHRTPLRGRAPPLSPRPRHRAPRPHRRRPGRLLRHLLQDHLPRPARRLGLRRPATSSTRSSSPSRPPTSTAQASAR